MNREIEIALGRFFESLCDHDYENTAKHHLSSFPIYSVAVKRLGTSLDRCIERYIKKQIIIIIIIKRYYRHCLTMFLVLQIYAWPYMLSVSVMWCNIEGLN